MSSPFRDLLLAWLVAAIAAPIVAVAAEDATVAPRKEEIVLDEVLVRGKRLEQVIVDAENEFYQLFNQLNKDDNYDVTCAYLPINPDNRLSATTRMCMPGFVSDAILDWTMFKLTCQPPLEDFDEFSCLDRNNDQRLSQRELAPRPDLDMQLPRLDRDNDGHLSRVEFPADVPGPTAPYRPPPPTLVIMEGTNRWHEHMMRVIRSDPRLLEMAGRIDDLHLEYMTVQQQKLEMQRLEAEATPKKVVELNRGPRAR